MMEKDRRRQSKHSDKVNRTRMSNIGLQQMNVNLYDNLKHTK